MVQTITERIAQRRRQILVHSYIYYEKNDNIVSDETWARWAKELVELQETYLDEAKTAPYAEDFRDFDASTGFHLPYRLPEIAATGNRLLYLRDKEREKKGDGVV